MDRPISPEEASAACREILVREPLLDASACRAIVAMLNRLHGYGVPDLETIKHQEQTLKKALTGITRAKDLLEQCGSPDDDLVALLRTIEILSREHQQRIQERGNRTRPRPAWERVARIVSSMVRQHLVAIGRRGGYKSRGSEVARITAWALRRMGFDKITPAAIEASFQRDQAHPEERFVTAEANFPLGD
jgi:hypothetical protein